MERPMVLKFPSFISKPSSLPGISRFSVISAASSSSSSSSSKKSSVSPFMVEYLTKELGFSREMAFKASRRLLHVKDSNRAEKVVEFLRSLGLNESQVTSTILRRPVILTSDVKKTLVPRIEFFKTLGGSEEELPELVVSYAFCFGNSVSGRLIPAVNFLRGILKDDTMVRDALKRCPWVLTNDPQKVPTRNLDFLRSKGMDESFIPSLVYKSPDVLVSTLQQLIISWETVENMGLNPKDASFADALHLVISASNENMKRKMEIMASFGFEKSTIYTLLKWLPNFFRSKDEHMTKKLDFLMNEVGLDHETLLKNTLQLTLSLEGRLIPRYKLIRSLQSKGIVGDEVDFSKAFCMTEEVFADEYVNKFKDVKEPDLLEAYKECQEGIGIGIGELSPKDSELKEVIQSQT